MSLKLNVGCNCCVDCPDDVCSNTTYEQEYDVTLAGLTYTEDVFGPACSLCNNFMGTRTVGFRKHAVPDPVTGWADGWDGTPYTSADDVPAGAVSACVWAYYFNMTCGNSYDWYDPATGLTQTNDFSLKTHGIVLAKFKISSSEYAWRLIYLYEMSVKCTQGETTETDTVNHGWYSWLDTPDNTDNCSRTSSEDWNTTNIVTAFLLTVDCGLYANVRFDYFCGYTDTGWERPIVENG